MARIAIAYLRAPDSLEHLTIPDAIDRVEAVERDELGAALERIASGAADTLLLARLAAAVGSLGELVRLLEWCSEAGAELVALDVGLDTATPSGRRMVTLVREIDRWGRDPRRPRRPRGRPGLGAGAPGLAQRIARMRERGMSLHAIAARLNEEGVPTPRGGAKWRPSSVQGALGYRRPRSGPPGAPPPPPRGRKPAPPPPNHERP